MTDTPDDAQPASAQPADAGGGAGASAPPPPPPGAAPPPPPPGATPRRLTRSSHGRMIWGVAAGLGEYFGVDPIIVRIVFVLLAFTGGAGVALYVLAALLMPGDRGEPPAVHDVMRRMDHARRHRWIGVALIVIAVALLAGNVHSADGTIFWGLALIAIGVLLFQQEGLSWSRLGSYAGGPGAAAPPPAPSGGSTPDAGTPAPPGPAWSAPTGGTSARTHWAAPPSSAWATSPPWHDRHAHRHGPPVGWITVALSLVAVGVAVLLANAGAITLTAGAALAVVLAVIGAGVVVSAFTGRRPWGLIVLGVLLLPVVATAGVVDEPLSGGLGDRTETPAAAQDVQRSYDLGMGQLTIDLTQAHLGAAPSRVHATVAFGQLVVLVPADLPVVMHGHAGAGTVDLVGREARGVQISEDARDPGTTSENALTLDLSVGVGQVRVERSGGSL